MNTETRIGRQDPTFSYVLPYTESAGQEAVELYELSGREVFPWQQSLIYDILAINEDGKWTHSKFGYEVPRRNGKGEILIIRELYGLAHGEKIMHTAHRTDTAHSAWERLCSILDAIEVPYKSIKAKGREVIELFNGGKICFRTRTSKGGLGEGYDLLVIDEAQEYQTDQESTLKYVITDSDNPQTIMCGTPPTPISSGTVFVDFRNSIMNGETQNFGWAEWSVEKISDIHDQDLWYECNPSLGLKLQLRSIADEIPGGDELDLNIQRLGYWVTYNLKSAISLADWEETLIDKVPDLTGKMCVGIKYHKSGETVSMAIAVKTKDDRIFVESIGNKTVRDGIDWILNFCTKANKGINKIIIDGDNGQEILTKAFNEVKIKKIHLPTVKDVKEANAEFEAGIFAKKICRMEQPSLTNIVTNCKKRPIGANGGFGYTELIEDYDISLMDSVLLAAWCVEHFKVRQTQKISY